MAEIAEYLVGRADELAVLGRALDELERGRPGAIELAGEPGIGKTRLLRELATRAEDRRFLTLSGVASEPERDLPFAVFLDALDRYVASLDRTRIGEMDLDALAELGHIFPSLRALGGGREVAPQHERHRSHRAVRQLLDLLATATPIVLILDDLHWADSASVELLGSLLRHRPASPVLLALGARPRQSPARLSAALERAHRTGTLIRITLSALSQDEAHALLGQDVDPAAVDELYKESGGNAFYLQQLARAVDLTKRIPSAAAELSSAIEVPRAVAAALTEEISLLSEPARQALRGAAVAGDPFELDVAAAAARTPEESTLDAIDELLTLDLIRQTDVPRRFGFRHPLVRRAVYETIPAGWRLRAHERAAEVLESRGAAAAARAYHVERSAREGDAEAIAVLTEAGVEVARLAPENAGHWFGSALRLMPHNAPAEDRVALLFARADALAAAGHFAQSHEALLAAMEIIPAASTDLRTRMATACAAVERLLGRYEQAHARLVNALGAVPAHASGDTVALLIELTLSEFYRSRFESMLQWARSAVTAAQASGDEVLTAAALAMPALAYAVSGPIETARSVRSEAASLIDRLPDEQMSLRPDAPAWLAAAELYLDLYAEADLHASRAITLARATGRRDPFFGLYQILPRVWYIRGKLNEAAELLDGAIESARLLGAPPALAGNLFNRSVVAVALGDLDVALTTAQEAADLGRRLDEGFVTAWAAVRLAGVLFELSQARRAVSVLVDGAGGDGLTLIPGGWRAYCLELLTRCWLALGEPERAGRAAELAASVAAATQLPLAEAWARRAAAAVALDAGDAALAAERALVSADAAEFVGAPIESALSRTLAGRALAAAGQTDSAVEQLQLSAVAMEACGALRWRDTAERELGKLGRRPHRRTRPAHGASGFESLTERERQVARLVVDRMTNAQIAANLFLSPKTVETHLRNIFNKLGVDGRVALARAMEGNHADPC